MSGAKLIAGRQIAAQIVSEIKADRLRHPNLKPGVVTFLVGSDLSSQIYISRKRKLAQELGFSFLLKEKDILTTTSELRREIQQYNEDPNFSAILIQFPLPQLIDPAKVIEVLDPSKDVDGFHPQNIYNFVRQEKYPQPVTPAAILACLKFAKKDDLYGQKIVLVAKSGVFSSPLVEYARYRGWDLELVSPGSSQLTTKVGQADILIVAAGQPGLIQPEMVLPGVTVIDVGITRQDGRVKGDVSPKVRLVADWVTPVPGGVGPVTVALLMKNVWELTKASV